MLNVKNRDGGRQIAIVIERKAGQRPGCGKNQCTYLHPAGKGPTVPPELAIQSGLVDPNIPLFSVQVRHQLVVV
jgi:hypothetical protein